ncbi:hypothetical protein ACE1OA_34425 [Streptomyces sp. JL2001]|uniref:hypothetical protein n=1 Tax=Streptomyces sp. JL2001 TaxID=3342488 RepID=UPI003D803551
MRDHETSSSAERGLTTEDIAGRRETAEGDGGRSAPPMYPGESADISDDTRTAGPVKEAPPRGDMPDETRDEAPRYHEDARTTDEAAAPERPRNGQAGEPATDSADADASALLGESDGQNFRDQWHEIQNRFVDDPREAVHAADTLVAEVMQTLAATFAERRQGLEGQWNQGENVDTESLRLALRQYRSFFNRLLSS